MPYLREKRSRLPRILRPSFPIMAREANCEKTQARALQALLSFLTPGTRGSFRVRLLRDFSLLPQMVSLLAGYDEATTTDATTDPCQ